MQLHFHVQLNAETIAGMTAKWMKSLKYFGISQGHVSNCELTERPNMQNKFNKAISLLY